ncbi:TlpA disulfide reductase family protein [Spirosoma sp.]|uniref:TlpA disulfide reductase family protein n=1 Tax=Spirosoma sp. TaxID=1899569 RepID=UPI002632A2A0|nr:TlpA disulfide reductase family protein [Spirosoma sp.]MCX6217994.1 TlpA disulfide reductase family protein [Spirosoma sp.]
MIQRKTLYKTSVWLFTVLFLSLPGHVQAQFTSSINGFFSKEWEGKQAMVVAKPLQGAPVIDTTTIVNRSAIFTLKLTEPCAAYLWIDGLKEDIQFFIDSPKISIGVESGLFGSAIIAGSASSEHWAEQFTRSKHGRDLDPDDQLALLNALTSGDSLTAFTLECKLDSLRTLDRNAVANLILEQPTLASSWYLFASSMFSYRQTLDLFNSLPTFASYPSYQRIKAELTQKQLGKKAVDFSLPITNGKVARLSDLTSRFVLIDFSIRHQVSCQKRHFDLKKLYQKYHPLGVEIVTVSVEFDRMYGQDALAKYPLPWIQLQDFMDTPTITKAFSVHYMPDNVLLDATKIMIGRDMSVQELDAMLEQLLNK